MLEYEEGHTKCGQRQEESPLEEGSPKDKIRLFVRALKKNFGLKGEKITGPLKKCLQITLNITEKEHGEDCQDERSKFPS